MQLAQRAEARRYQKGKNLGESSSAATTHADAVNRWENKSRMHGAYSSTLRPFNQRLLSCFVQPRCYTLSEGLAVCYHRLCTKGIFFSCANKNNVQLIWEQNASVLLSSTYGERVREQVTTFCYTLMFAAVWCEPALHSACCAVWIVCVLY